MAIEKERLSPDARVPPWVWFEHLARYEFGSGFVKDKVVVDCACGSGIGSRAFAKAGAKSVAAFDVSAEEIELARARHTLPNLTFRHGSALALPIEAHSVDVYISFETIEHLADDLGFLKEVLRVLKPNGLFICSTPNRIVTNPGTSLTDAPWNRFHVREYSEEEFVARLRASFPQISLYGQNPKRAWLARAMERAGRVLPRHGAVRINQVMKLPQFVGDSAARHAVEDLKPGYSYEYLVAVCGA
jgi:ubiquinone/menaquinone biosynthesis C-methylase UbiE